MSKVVFPCVKSANTKIQMHKYSISKSARKTQHVVYFWKEDFSRISKIIYRAECFPFRDFYVEPPLSRFDNNSCYKITVLTNFRISLGNSSVLHWNSMLISTGVYQTSVKKGRKIWSKTKFVSDKRAPEPMCPRRAFGTERPFLEKRKAGGDSEGASGRR